MARAIWQAIFDSTFPETGSVGRWLAMRAARAAMRADRRF